MADWADKSSCPACLPGGLRAIKSKACAGLTLRQRKHEQMMKADAQPVTGDPVSFAVVMLTIAISTALDVIPGDGIVLAATDFFVNQSSLSGEAYPVGKGPTRPQDPSREGEGALRRRGNDDLTAAFTSADGVLA